MIVKCLFESVFSMVTVQPGLRSGADRVKTKT